MSGGLWRAACNGPLPSGGPSLPVGFDSAILHLLPALIQAQMIHRRLLMRSVKGMLEKHALTLCDDSVSPSAAVAEATGCCSIDDEEVGYDDKDGEGRGCVGN